jgi:hypothetical protein
MTASRIPPRPPRRSARPNPRRAALLQAGAVLAGAVLPGASARAQRSRAIPETAEIGRLSISVFPDATLDGRPVRLGPGTRIYDAQSMIKPPGSLSGEHKVAYVRGAMNEINQIWLVNDAEYRAIADRIAAARRAGAQR